MKSGLAAPTEIDARQRPPRQAHAIAAQTAEFGLALARSLAVGIAVLATIVLVYSFLLALADGAAVPQALARAGGAAADYGRHLLRGELGMSIAASSTRNPLSVATIVPQLFARSLGLLTLALLCATAVGVVIGTLAALRRHGRRADLLLVMSIVGVSAPSFFVALLLQQLAIAWTKRMGHALLPVGGFGWDLHMVLPVLVLAARPLAQITRMTFVSVGRVLDEDFVRTARSKGLRRDRILLRHVARNTAIPIVTTLGVSLRFSLSSLPVVELFFGWPGAGYMLIKSIASGDNNLAIALLLCFGTLFILTNIALELAYSLLDPRIRAWPRQAGRIDRMFSGLGAFGQALGTAVLAPLTPTWWRARAESIVAAVAPAAWRSSWQTLRDAISPPGPGQTRTGARGDGMLWGGLVLLAGLTVVVIAGPQLAPHSPFTTQGMVYADGDFLIPPFAPDVTHRWGTDVLGRDILSLVLAGAQQTLTLAVLVTAARLALGIVLGAVAGWSNGRLADRLILGTAEVLAAFPTLVLAMLVILALGIRGGYRPFLIGLSVVGWGELMQFVRSEVIALRPRAFVESAYAVGASTPRILARHLAPNLAPALTSLAALEMGGVLMLLGELGFIGIFIGGGAFAELVVDAPEFHYSDVPEWGALLSNVRLYARAYVWTALYPALAFFVAILGFNLAGEGLRKIVDRGGLRLNWLFNRYVLLGLVLAVTGVGRLATNGGATAFYREQAREFDGRLALDHARWLGDEARAGRTLGSQGLGAGADYVADQFAVLGLQRGADASYLQTRPREYLQLDAVPQLQIDDGGDPLYYRHDFAEFAGPFRINGAAAGRVHVLAAGDIAGSRTGFSSQLPRPLRDLVLDDAVLLLFDPDDVLRFSRLAYRGMLVVVEDDADLARVQTLRALDPANTNFGGRSTGQEAPVLAISQATAERLLGATGESVASVRRRLAELLPDEVYTLDTGQTAVLTVAGTVHAGVETVNVLGHLPAVQGQNLGGQLIVVLAQLDAPPASPEGVVYPGANDNASGVGVMLEIIRTMQETGYRPYKTFLFVAYSGEGTEGGNSVDPANVTKYLEAKLGFEENFTVEAVVDLRGLGDGTGQRLAIDSGGSLRLTELFEDAARRMGQATIRVGEGVDLGVMFEATRSTPAGQRAPQIALRWEGWEATSRTVDDRAGLLDEAKLAAAGRTIALGLMVLGRETEY